MSIVNQSVVSTTKCLFNQVVEGNLSKVQVYFVSLGFCGQWKQGREEGGERHITLTGYI